MLIDLVLDEVTHHEVVAQFGEAHGCVFSVLGHSVAVGAILQQEAHHISIPPLTCLKTKTVHLKTNFSKVVFLMNHWSSRYTEQGHNYGKLKGLNKHTHTHTHIFTITTVIVIGACN